MRTGLKSSITLQQIPKTPWRTHQVMSYKDLLQNKSFQIDTVTQCLTDDCKLCSGLYVNNTLRHRLVCKCRCHVTKKKNLMVNDISYTSTTDEAIQ